MTVMRTLFASLALAALSVPAPAFSQASDFTLVNGTGQALGNLSIRRTGSEAWRPLGAAPSAGARSPISFSDPDCAFDIRAAGNGGNEIVWNGVNLCEVSAVTLRLAAGTPYVEYR